MIEGKENPVEDWTSCLTKLWCIEAWAAMDIVTRNGWNLLHVCSMFGDEIILNYVIRAFDKRSKILECREDLPKTAKDLSILPYYYHMESQCKKRYTPFLLSVKNDRVGLVKIFIKERCDIYTKNEKLQNALHIACLHGNIELIQHLVRIDSDKNILRNEKDLRSRKPKDLDVSGSYSKAFLHIWDHAKNGNIDDIGYLVQEGGYSVNEQTTKLKLTPLHVAIESRQLMCIRFLVQLGADVKIKTSKGDTPLDIAISMRDATYVNIVMRLLRGEQSITGLKYSEDELDKFYMNITKKDAVSNKRIGIKRIGSYHMIPKFSSKKTKLETEKNCEKFWNLMRKKLIEKKISVSELFEIMDKNKDNSLSPLEFEGMVLWLGMPLKSEEIQSMAMVADKNLNGQIEYSEIVQQIVEAANRERSDLKSRGFTPKKSESLPKLNVSNIF